MRVFHLIQKAHSTLFRAADHALRKDVKITATQSTVLLLLIAEDGLPVSQIAHNLSMGKSSLTTLIDRMEKTGLVLRKKGLNDGRVQNVFIQDAGERLAIRAIPALKQINETLLEPFDTAERKTIQNFLEHVSNNAEDIVEKSRMEITDAN